MEDAKWGVTWPALRIVDGVPGSIPGRLTIEAYTEKAEYGAYAEEERRANALLIAAAPELYEALEKLAGCVTGMFAIAGDELRDHSVLGNTLFDVVKAALRNALEALAKARGEGGENE